VLEIRFNRVEVTAGFPTTHPSLAPGPYARLTIHDTGHGICVHLSRCLQIGAVGSFSADRLTCPAAELIQDRGPPTPVGICAAMPEQRGDFLPALHRLGSLQVEGLRHRLTGHGQLQGQAPGCRGASVRASPSCDGRVCL
jgi:hypothetical protein